MRSFTVTGTAPAASTAARTTSARSRRLTGSAAPPPPRMTLGTGQPKLRSMWSTGATPRASSPATRRRAASSTVAGSEPYSCSERIRSAGGWRAISQLRSLQLYGSGPATVAEAARRLVAGDDARGVAPVDHIDLNFGCPVPKVMRGGGGAALPVKRRLLAEVVRAAVDAAGAVPVTVKLRMGLDDERLTYLDAGRIAAGEGAAAVTLHARTALQGYAGKARWEAIATLKAALPDTPVLGNGDVWSAEDALAMVAATGCDGVVVGRGCLGRPWLFADLP